MSKHAVAEWAFAAALAGLPWMAPDRLRALLQRRAPSECWHGLASGRIGEVPPSWVRRARAVDVAAVDVAHRSAGVTVSVLGEPGYPVALSSDHEAPVVLFSVGALDRLGPPAVAIVGTRRCTHYGREVAAALGRALAAAGVSVVSGLALGVDGAAHEGALGAGGAPPVGVVASGLDVVYPRRHRSLWDRVAAAGVLLSEAPLGTRPEPWRFPLRNRVIAALADVVVVVESHAAGGSLHTVAAAATRDRPVLAVPGAVSSPASAGTNALLADGCGPARDAADVLVALGLEGVAPVPTGAPADGRRARPSGVDAAVLDAVGWSPTTVDEVLARSGLAPPRATAALVRLEAAGWVHGDAGVWERKGVP